MRLFRECGTQWHHGFDGRTGLIYSELRAAAPDVGVEWSPTLFLFVRVLEDEYLQIQNEALAESRAKE